eukprot:Skav214948  [mRNA]  locus=scaffold2244:134350:146475:+ [translate_table: standard]
MLIHAEKTMTGEETTRMQSPDRLINCEAEGLAGIFGVPERYIDSITFKSLGGWSSEDAAPYWQVQRKGEVLIVGVTCVNTMAAGLKYCDRALTVSPSYAVECCTDPEKGGDPAAARCRIGIPLQAGQVHRLRAIRTVGNHALLTSDIAKTELKQSYRAQNGLTGCTGPLMLGWLGFSCAQQGLLKHNLASLNYRNAMDHEDTEMQVVIVGAGRADLVAQTKARVGRQLARQAVEKKFPNKFFYAGWMGPERYALLAGCDFTLLPSRWEPCGLVQMEAMRLGTLPIVAPTGGLKDTVEVRSSAAGSSNCDNMDRDGPCEALGG